MVKVKSIVVDDMEHCIVCGNPLVAIHHCFEGTARRKISDQYGLIVPLCPIHHNMSNKGVHFNKTLELRIKRLAQKKFEAEYGHDEFMKVIGRDYL